MLGLVRHSPSWYRDRLREELYERRAAHTSWRKLSETADVLFCISRAHYDGFPVRNAPLPSVATCYGRFLYTYMLAKYTSRWMFYRAVAISCGATQHDCVREVVNPSKDKKLNEVALRHQLDPIKFKRVARQLRRVWPLLP
ncbi:hypothetical protein PG985_005622 [Apiospora marii]|uniref:uncharacterized protein n=1 Tax=Apiospora marii TaxID=335849 RepID=UPI003130C557